MRPITVYGIRSDDKRSIHEVTIPFNKKGVLNALNDALDYGNPYSPDECNEGGEYITIEFYSTRKEAEAEQRFNKYAEQVISQVSPEAY